MQILDGKGKGTLASVSSENKLATTSVTASPQQHASSAFGRAFQVVSGVQNITPAAAFGILALRNDSTLNMILTYIRVAVDEVEVAQALTELYVGGVWVDGTPVADPVNLNGRFAIESGITAHTNAIPTASSPIDARWLRGPDEVVYRKEGSIILPTNGVFSARVTPTTDLVNAHARVSFIMLSDIELADL